MAGVGGVGAGDAGPMGAAEKLGRGSSMEAGGIASRAAAEPEAVRQRIGCEQYD